MANKSKKITIAITGANGYIGTRLIEKLVTEGYAKKYSILALVHSAHHIKKLPLVKYREFNILKKKLHALKNVDIVVHLAGSKNNDMDNASKLNIVGTNNLVNACLKYSINKVIFASTGAVYGSSKSRKKEDSVPEPVNIYGLTKLAAEKILKHNYQGKLIILRFPNIYGEDQEDGVIYNFVKNISLGKSITLFGDGRQLRDFLYIEDAITAIIKSITLNKTGVFNIGTGKGYSLNQVIRLIQIALGKNYSRGKNNVKYIKEGKDSLKYLILDPDKAKKELMFKPKDNFNTNLKKIILSMRIKPLKSL